MPHLKLAGSWGYVMRMQPNWPMDAALPALVEFLAEEGRSPGHGRICRGNPAEPGAQAARARVSPRRRKRMTRLTQRLPVLFLALLASSLAHADSAHLQVVQAVAGEAEGRGEYVDVTFTPGSRGPLAEFTRARVGKRVEFRVDDQVLTVVTVQGAIETSGLRLSAGGSGLAASPPPTSSASWNPAPMSRSPTPARQNRTACSTWTPARPSTRARRASRRRASARRARSPE